MNRAATLLRYARDLRNWPAVAALHNPRLFRTRPATSLHLRDGHTIHLLDAAAEIRAYASIYWHHCYDGDFAGIPQNGNVIDLGANVGMFALYAATRLVPGGHVLAVEANPPCAARLRLTTQDCANVTIWEGAVGGSGELWLSTDSLGASIFHDAASTSRVACQSIAPEKVLRYFARIDLLKINMEGAEYPFLLEQSDELFSSVERITVKWHKGEISNGHDPAELAARLRALGFSIKRHQEIWNDGRGLITGITTAYRSLTTSR